MIGLVIAIHVLICLLLMIIVLIQSGRGGGLVESFSSVESMFGPKTNEFLTRTTTWLSIAFFATCLWLAFISARQSRSLMKHAPVPAAATAPITAQPAAPAAATTPAAEKPADNARPAPVTPEGAK